MKKWHVQVLARIRDLRRDRVHPVERVEEAMIPARRGIGRREQLDASVPLRMHLAQRNGRAGDVAADGRYDLYT